MTRPWPPFKWTLQQPIAMIYKQLQLRRFFPSFIWLKNWKFLARNNTVQRASRGRLPVRLPRQTIVMKKPMRKHVLICKSCFWGDRLLNEYFNNPLRLFINSSNFTEFFHQTNELLQAKRISSGKRITLRYWKAGLFNEKRVYSKLFWISISTKREDWLFSVYSAFLRTTVWWGRRIVHLEIR